MSENGFKILRLKTGTPARIKKDSIDFSVCEIQPGDTPHDWFADGDETNVYDSVCFITHTTENTHNVIRENIKNAPMYNGDIVGTGPRYCPSLEDKVMRFPEHTSHHVFLEPEGYNNDLIYPNGISTSFGSDVQDKWIRTIPGLENAQIVRYGYAIEYDAIDARALNDKLQSKDIPHMFFAGQINGTSGYEEAAGQGIIAGINAHINCHGGEPFVLGRDEVYIGVLIDDLVTKGVDEPYRMFTSRAEYRILLRQDDADMRLTEKAYHLGLVKKDRYDMLVSKRKAVNEIIEFTKKFSIKAALINDALEKLGTAPLTRGCKLIDLIIRPQITIESISEYIPPFKAMLDQITDRKEEIIEAAEVLIKYQGYIDRERMIADKIHRLESIRIKGKFDYNSLNSLSTEARQKLIKIDPETLAQASRIPGISPSDINVLLVLLGR